MISAAQFIAKISALTLFNSAFIKAKPRLLILTVVCLLAAVNARALNYTVTNTSDAGAGSLRNAVTTANGTTADDTITFNVPANDPNCTSGGVCTITLTSGALTINDVSTAGKLTITNPTGASNLLISGNNASRVFRVDSGGNLTLSGLTVTKGNVQGDSGAGIYNLGTLTITNSIVSGNTTNYYGGGIFNYGTTMLTNTTVSGNTASSGGGIFTEEDGTLSLMNSIVSGNTASEFGGGIETYVAGTTTLINSTVSGNTATNAFGGGIYNTGSSLTITNSTVSGNMAGINGGGIYNDSTSTLPLNLTSVTVAYNTASNFGGGVYNQSGTANLRNTIVAKNTGGANSPDYGGLISSTSTFNLIGNGTGTSGITNDSGGNQVGTSGSSIDPMLDSALALNGGTTPNHALLPNSPAIDKGNDTGTDQRGLTRPINLPSYPDAAGGNAADIGAFEVQAAPTAAAVSIGGRVTVGNRGLASARVTLTDMNGDMRDVLTDAFGYYRFDDVTAGGTYILSVFHKRYTFAQPSQVLNAIDDATEVNFIGNSEKRLRIF